MASVDEFTPMPLTDVDMICCPSLEGNDCVRLLEANFFETKVFDTTAAEIADLVVAVCEVVVFTVDFPFAMTGILGFDVWVT